MQHYFYLAHHSLHSHSFIVYDRIRNGRCKVRSDRYQNCFSHSSNPLTPHSPPNPILYKGRGLTSSGLLRKWGCFALTWNFIKSKYLQCFSVCCFFNFESYFFWNIKLLSHFHLQSWKHLYLIFRLGSS